MIKRAVQIGSKYYPNKTFGMVIMLLLSFIGIAGESPYSIDFSLQENVDEITLTIDLNEESLNHLLYVIAPETVKQNELDLNAYVDLYSNYFNEKLSIKVNQQHQQLELLDYAINGANTFFQYRLTNHEGVLRDFEFRVEGFDYYKYPKFNVKVKDNLANNWACELNKVNNLCTKSIADLQKSRAEKERKGSKIKDPEAPQYDEFQWWYLLPLVLMIPILYITFFKGKG